MSAKILLDLIACYWLKFEFHDGTLSFIDRFSYFSNKIIDAFSDAMNKGYIIVNMYVQNFIIIISVQPVPKDLIDDIDGLVQERRNSSALAMELRLSCINPSIC